jgi:hypothetical protein
MEIFVFSSKNLTNIWAGIGARLWAVAPRQPSASAAGRVTKSQNMRVGSFGILYCVETHSLTTPFIVYSRPDVERVVADVWPEKWVLPFNMFPLGTPNLQLRANEAKRILPIFKKTGETSFGNIFHVQALTAFATTKIDNADWEILVDRLAARTAN